MTNTTSSSSYREIRAIHNESTIRVYQAYNDAIADAAVKANSFRGPLDAGLWSRTRMTWIKPSKMWMAYRCGWTLLKDKNQSRVLALDLSRSQFEKLLMEHAQVTDHNSKKQGKNQNTKKCRDSSVVVQWDPERYMDLDAEPKQAYTSSDLTVRSIQIGLRGSAVEALLDPNFVLRITDVTQHFREAFEAIQQCNLEQAAEALWPGNEKESKMEISDALQRVLKMNVQTTRLQPQKEVVPKKKAVVVLGSAANPPHQGHFHCLKVGKEKAEELGFDVLFTSIAIAPYGYVRQKMRRNQRDFEDGDSNTLVLSDDDRLHALSLMASVEKDQEKATNNFAQSISFRPPTRCYGSALECGRHMRPDKDTVVIVVVGGDRAKSKWKKQPKPDQVTVCCARNDSQLNDLQEAFAQDEKEGLVLDKDYYFALDVGPPTSSTIVRSILLQQLSPEEKSVELLKHGYSKEAATFLCSLSI